MGWTLDRAGGVWKCDSYADLNYAEINNLAEYGQPFSPYEKGFLHDFDPDFGNVVIEMPQTEVMTNGYGKNIKAESFPVVRRFLHEKHTLPCGTLTFDDLVAQRFATTKPKNDKRISTKELYPFQGSKYGIAAGDIAGSDAAYIHGTVSFALMKGTRFINAAAFRRVEAEIGAGDDNWDFNSSTVSNRLNRTVAVLVGPDHYNLTAPIKIQFRGPGKTSIAEKK
jgi:hypothetical protein